MQYQEILRELTIFKITQIDKLPVYSSPDNFESCLHVLEFMNWEKRTIFKSNILHIYDVPINMNEYIMVSLEKDTTNIKIYNNLTFLLIIPEKYRSMNV